MSGRAVFVGWTPTFTAPVSTRPSSTASYNGTIIETVTDSYRLLGTQAPAEGRAKAG